MLHRITTIPFKAQFPLKGVRNFFFAKPNSAKNDDFVLKIVKHVKIIKTNKKRLRQNYFNGIRNRSFGTYVKFSEKLTLLPSDTHT